VDNNASLSSTLIPCLHILSLIQVFIALLPVTSLDKIREEWRVAAVVKLVDEAALAMNLNDETGGGNERKTRQATPKQYCTTAADVG